MGFPTFGGLDYTRAASAAARVSTWIDDEPVNQAMTPLEQLLMRTVVKSGEEFGESCEAIIGMTGQNPRKGYTHTREHLFKEQMDIAATAVLAIEHMLGNNGEGLRLVAEHILFLERRMAESRHRHGESGGVPATG